MNKRITFAVAVYAVLERDGKIFFGRRFGTGYMDGWWQVFAGHAETGEVPTQTLIRESKEEMDIIIDPLDCELIHTSARPQHDETGNRLDLFFRIRKWKGEPKNAELHKCDAVEWVSLEGLPEKTVPHVRDCLRMAAKGVRYSEFDLDYIEREYGGLHVSHYK